MKQSQLDQIGGGNIDLRPTSVPEKEFYASNTPIFYVENAKNIRLSNGTMSWGDNITQPYFTAPVEAIDVNTLSIDRVTASPSPANPSAPLVIAKGCTNLENHINK